MAGEISLPGMGGLTRFREEYESKLKITPIQVIIAIIAVIVLVLSLRIFMPLG
jgi:preprotein translocase subunit Sec61beta